MEVMLGQRGAPSRWFGARPLVLRLNGRSVRQNLRIDARAGALVYWTFYRVRAGRVPMSSAARGVPGGAVSAHCRHARSREADDHADVAKPSRPDQDAPAAACRMASTAYQRRE
jgi:hypothetical protein